MHTKPKKSLGQNFLTDQNIQKKIIAFCDLNEKDVVLEIGPGQGAMTNWIVPRVKRFYAVELDRQLAGSLGEKFVDDPKVKVIHQDILEFDLQKELKQETKIKVFGNIPYYITSPIIEHLFQYRGFIGSIFLTVQKEFGQRIVAPYGSEHYGSFSCFVQYYSYPKMLFTIKKNSFYPVPKVDSCFLELAIRREPLFKIKDEKFLFKIIRTAFQQRRKTLKNSLSGLVGQPVLNEFFAKFDLDPLIRPEQVSLEQFMHLANSQPLHKF